MPGEGLGHYFLGAQRVGGPGGIAGHRCWAGGVVDGGVGGEGFRSCFSDSGLFVPPSGLPVLF